MLPVHEDRPYSWLPQRSALLRFLEQLALKLEKPINLLVGDTRLNPLYYTGPLATFLLLVVILTGLYLTLFFQFSFEAAYGSVVKIESQPIARVVRAIHRYGSDAAMIVSLLHAFRILFMGRFRGPRWLAWVSGVVMMVALWLAGVSGYWLTWDQSAQLITMSFTNLLRHYTPFGASFAAWLLVAGNTDRSWIFIAILLLAHILLSALLGLFFWFHILRLNRPKYLPERHWLIVLGGVLLVISAAAPIGLLPMADLYHLPGQITFDPLFLFFLPAELNLPNGWFWGGLLAVTLAAGLIPWLSFRRKPAPRVVIDPARCTGCTHCSIDCPYKAIVMAPRANGGSAKSVALEYPDLCVSCGLCIGSCDGNAISLGDLSTELLWNTVQTRLAMGQQRTPAAKLNLIFTCERHAAQGASPYLSRGAAGQPRENDPEMMIIALPCVASLHPNLLGRIVEAGAAEVRVIGCPLEDCAQREGSLWTEERLNRKRLPRLKRDYENAPISTLWLSPDAFPQAALMTAPTPAVVADDNQKRGFTWQGLSWRNFVPAVILLGLVLSLPVWLNKSSFQPYPAPADQAVVQVILPDPAESFAFLAGHPPADLTLWPTRLELQIDGQVVFEKLYDPTELFSARADSLFKELPLIPGEHLLRLSFEGGKRGPLIISVKKASFIPGQVVILGPDKIEQPPVEGGKTHKSIGE